MGATASATAGATTSSSPPGHASALDVGMPIVAAISATSFRVGHVKKVVGEAVTFEVLTKGDDEGSRPSWTVQRSEAWPLVAVADARVAETMLCRADASAFVPCSVRGVVPERVTVVDSSGVERTVSARDLVRPDGATAARLAAYLEREDGRRRFDAALENEGPPLTPSGWSPKAGEVVVAQFVALAWYSARVIDVRDGPAGKKARVKWLADSWPDRDLPWSELAPSGARAAKIEAGAFLLARPDAESAPWIAGRITGSSDDTVRFVDRDGTARTAAVGDVVLLQRRAR